jgi:hypothetical protein
MGGGAPGCITIEKILRSRAVVGAVSNCVVTSYLWTYILFSRLLLSMTPYPRRIPQTEKRISTGNKRTWTELTTGARSTEAVLTLHNRYPSFWMMMLPEWHTHSGISHTPTLAFCTTFFIAVCVTLLQISDAADMICRNTDVCAVFLSHAFMFMS